MDILLRYYCNDGWGDIDYEHFIFPGGEHHVKLEKRTLEIAKKRADVVRFDCRPLNNSFIKLALLKEAIDHHFNCPKDLFIPYLPYSRQDRRCEDNEAFSLKVIAKFINELKFDKVVTLDVHSEVAQALINNCENRPIEYAKCFTQSDFDCIISPDSGGVKRAFKCAQELDLPLIKADKVRCTKTGAITSTEVYSTKTFLLNSHCLIVDDICDGGRTFTELAKELKKLGVSQVSLWVTHGIFSKGLRVFDGLIDDIYTTTSVPLCENFKYDNRNAKVKLHRILI